MKTLFALSLLAFALLFPAVSQAQTNVVNSDTVGLAWNPNTEPDLGGYRVYLTQNTNAWTHAKNVGLVSTAQIQLPAQGRWFMMITATNTAGLESLPSNIVEYTTPNGPAKPSTFRLVSSSAVRASTVTTVETLTFLP